MSINIMLTAFVVLLVFSVGTIGIVIAVTLLRDADGRVAALETPAAARSIFFVFFLFCKFNKCAMIREQNRNRNR
jgi:hypothetical protein